ncbi:MAG: AI-2E family transporter [Gammaproteobacteria bacterium]|nr:AI-2E family transporter [Gammaproteobacteria bacterium]
MFEFLSAWYRRYFTDPQAALLVVLLVVGFIVIYFMGRMLAPLLSAVIIAYLLEGPVSKLERRMPRLAAVGVIFVLFLAFLAFLVVVLLPIVFRQAGQFFHEFPGWVNKGQDLLLRLPQQYPQFISEEAVRDVFVAFRGGISDLGQGILSVSLASIPAIIAVLVYLVLVPLMIFFFLKDKVMIVHWLGRFLPSERRLVSHLWAELDDQFGNYIRGKVYEIIIVGAASYVVFKILGLNYSSLLAISVGLSVLIPYIGAAVVTLPVAIVGYFQWGMGWDFGWLMAAYLVLQFLDGNVLVPVLFSDVVNIHPVAIIVAILVFGGLWGFWGVFFAIPLATLVKALINIWPKREETLEITG